MVRRNLKGFKVGADSEEVAEVAETLETDKEEVTEVTETLETDEEDKEKQKTKEEIAKKIEKAKNEQYITQEEKEWMKEKQQLIARIKELEAEVDSLSFNYIRNKKRKENTIAKKEFKISAPIRRDIWDKTKELLKQEKGLMMRPVLRKYIEDWMKDVKSWESKQKPGEGEVLVYEFDKKYYPVYDYEKYERKQTGFSVEEEMKKEFSDLTARLSIRQGEVIENLCADIARDIFQDTLKYSKEAEKKVEKVYNENILEDIKEKAKTAVK